MKFEFLVPAAIEFRQALEWYENRSGKAAEGFRAEVTAAIRKAQLHPTSAGFRIGHRVRKISLKRYDYGVLFFVHGSMLYIVAIAHNNADLATGRIDWIELPIRRLDAKKDVFSGLVHLMAAKGLAALPPVSPAGI